MCDTIFFMATYTLIGLGNPGTEYEKTRHNTGRIILEEIRKAFEFPDWKSDKKSNSLISKGKVDRVGLVLVMPETFMNKSGESVKYYITDAKSASKLIVIHDELDLPIGRIKMSFNKSSGGHRGVESIIKAIKTEMFYRIRVGISSSTAKGDLKKPKGEEAVEKCILGEFKDEEMKTLKKLSKKVIEAIKVIDEKGIESVVTIVNTD